MTAVSLLIPEALSDEDFVTMSTREKLIDFMGLVMNLSSVSYNSNSTYQQVSIDISAHSPLLLRLL